MSDYLIYTDGSALGMAARAAGGGPVRGGLGIRILDLDGSILYEGGRGECTVGTTNNRMEQKAILEAIAYVYKHPELFKSGCSFTIMTDSRYCVDCYHAYLPKWKANGWRKKKGSILNLDLWKRLDAAAKYVEFKLCWVRAHDEDEHGNPIDEHNHAVDEIAGWFSERAKPNA